jgi:hypothetical protein
MPSGFSGVTVPAGSSEPDSRRLPPRRFRGIIEPPLWAAPHLFHGRLIHCYLGHGGVLGGERRSVSLR